jgi:tight adherence protein B
VEIIIPAVLIFVITVVVIEMSLYAYRTVRHPDRAKIRQRLRTMPSKKLETEPTRDVLRKSVLSDVPLLHELLRRMTGIERLDRLRHHANARYPIGFFILLAFVLALIGFSVSSYMMENRLASLAISALLLAAPFLYLVNKKQKRTKKFQTQLPEALDMISRSMKAGHAFTTGMRLAADEFDDPLGPELSYALDEINFGVSVPEALRNLGERVDSQDLNFFIVSVILQRETGGNLAEIIESIAHLIRERFKLLDKIKALSAEGKISAIILCCLPFIVVFFLYFRNASYIMTLFRDPTGKIMVGVALCMMILGAYIMKRIINIKV